MCKIIIKRQGPFIEEIFREREEREKAEARG